MIHSQKGEKMENKNQKVNYIFIVVIVLLILLLLVGNAYFRQYTLTFIVISDLLQFCMYFIICLTIAYFCIYNKNKSKKTLIIIIILSMLLSILFTKNDYKQYTIEGRKIHPIEMYLRNLGDLIEKDTIQINTKDAKIIYDSIYHHTIRSGRSSYTTIYYISINNDEYILPLKLKQTDRLLPVRPLSYTLEKSLLYQKTYGEKTINTITVYKNSKLVKSINGIDMDQSIEKILEKAENNNYKISIKLKDDKTIEYITQGCTFEEFVNNENVRLGIFNKENRLITDKNMKQDDTFPTNLPDGEYRVCIISSPNRKEISNSITYVLKNHTITAVHV